MANTKKYCHVLDDVPKTPHYAILNSRSIHVPGDEESRLRPGHGYGEHVMHVLDYIAFTDVNEWAAEVKSLATNTQAKQFLAIKVNPSTVETEVKVTITPAPEHQYTLICPTCGLKAYQVLRDTKATRVCPNDHHWLPSEDAQNGQ
jgi:endogenous inhibitor of DNA gyrase (YacG/DUF329 family)